MSRKTTRALALWLLFLTAAPSLFAGDGTIRHNPNAVPNEYIVVLNTDLPATSVDAAAKDLAKSFNGSLHKSWNHAVKGFYVTMTEARAQAMSRDPRIKYVEENAAIYLSYVSGTQNTTIDPVANCTMPVNDCTSNPLAHLDRIDQRALPLDNAYHYCNTGSGSTVYVVDSGVMRTHGEFIQANVKDGYAASEGLAWVASTIYTIGARIRDGVNGNTWICMSTPNGVSGTSGSTSPNLSGGIGSVVTDNQLTWRNFGKTDPAYNPCQGGGGTGGWPVPATFGSADYNNYLNEVFFLGHGTSTASMVAGQSVGSAKDAIIVPVKVMRCDYYEARKIVSGHSYIYGDRILSDNGQMWICTSAGSATNTNTGSWNPRGGSVITDGSLSWTNIGNGSPSPGANDVGTIGMLIDGVDWILDSSRNPNPINHSIATFSTYRVAGETGLTGSGSFEEAVENLIANGVTVFASANNQNGDACNTSPARLSRDNTDATLGPVAKRKVITVGGSMLSNANGVEGRWICTGTCVEPGSNTGFCVSIFAPAQNLRSAQMSGAPDYRRFASDPNGFAADASGTSFSAPLAAGVGAQFLELYPNGGPDDVYNALVNSSAKGVLDSTTLQSGSVSTNAPNRLLQTTPIWIYSSPTPAAQSVPYGNNATLTVSAVGTATLSYQWYVGSPSNTSTPASGASATTASLVVPVTSNATYWCRVSMTSCIGGTVSIDSPGYNVSSFCVPPMLGTTFTATPSTITSGGTSRLEVGSATGTAPLTYLFYTAGGTLVGTSTNKRVNVSPAVTTSYYYKVSNACGTTAASSLVTVTVN